MSERKNVIVLSAKPWQMPDEKTGEIRTGITLHYLLTGSLEPYQSSDGKIFGYIPIKQSISSDEINNLKNLPGIYEVDEEYVQNNDGVKLRVHSLAYVSDFSVPFTSDKKK